MMRTQILSTNYASIRLMREALKGLEYEHETMELKLHKMIHQHNEKQQELKRFEDSINLMRLRIQAKRNQITKIKTEFQELN